MATALTRRSSRPRDDRYVTWLVFLSLSQHVGRTVSGKGFPDKETLDLGKVAEGRIQRHSCRSVYDGEESRKMPRGPLSLLWSL